jgi:hypothetical protein
MGIDIYSWVRKHERKIFLGLTLLIGFSFVITYEVLFVIEKIRKNAPAGYIFGEKVKMYDFYLKKMYWNALIRILTRKLYIPPTSILNVYGLLEDDELEKGGPKERYVSPMTLKNKGMWKILILLKSAQERKVYITQKEVEKELKRIFPDENELQEALAEFGLRKDLFLETFKEYLIIRKLQDYYYHESKPGDLNKAFELYENENKTVKINYYLYNLKSEVEYLRKVGIPSQISFINRNYAHWNPKEKIKLRLLYYNFENLKKEVAKPTEEEKQKYYQENKEKFAEKSEKKENQGEKKYKPYSDTAVQKKIEEEIIENKVKELANKKIEEVFEYLFMEGSNIEDYKQLAEKFNLEYTETDYFIPSEFSSLGLGYSSTLVKELNNAKVSKQFKRFEIPNKTIGFYQVIDKARPKTPGYYFMNYLGRIKTPYRLNFEEKAKELENFPKKLKEKAKELYDILTTKYADEMKNKGPYDRLNFERALKKEAFYKTLNELRPTAKIDSTTFKYDEDLKIKEISFREVTSKAKELDIGEYDYHCKDKPYYVCIIYIIEEKMAPDPKEFIAKKDEYLEKSLFTYTKDQIQKIYLKTLQDLAKLESKVPIDKNDKADDYGEFR